MLWRWYRYELYRIFTLYSTTLLERHIPVSYTHLDVYKRQVQSKTSFPSIHSCSWMWTITFHRNFFLGNFFRFRTTMGVTCAPQFNYASVYGMSCWSDCFRHHTFFINTHDHGHLSKDRTLVSIRILRQIRIVYMPHLYNKSLKFNKFIFVFSR